MRNRGGHFSGPRHPPTGHRGGGRGGHRQNFNRNHHQQDHRRPQESYHHNGHGGGNTRPYHNGPPGRDPNWRSPDYYGHPPPRHGPNDLDRDRSQASSQYQNIHIQDRDREHQNRAPGGHRAPHPPEVATMNDQSRQDRPPQGAPGNGHTEPRRRDAPDDDPQQPPTKRNKTEEDEGLSPEDREAKEAEKKARDGEWNLLVDKWTAIEAAKTEDRIKIVDELDERKLALLFLHSGVRVPPLDNLCFRKDEWNSCKDQATAAAIKKAELLYKKNKNYDSDGYSVESEESVGCPVDAPDPDEEDTILFAKNLRYCGPAIAGFLITALVSENEKEICACPACCRDKFNAPPVMWRFWYTSGMRFEPHDAKSRLYEPAPFIKHIEEKMKSSGFEGKLHEVLYVFLKKLFEDYHAPRIPHLAFLTGAPKKDDQGLKTFNYDKKKKAERIVASNLRE